MYFDIHVDVRTVKANRFIQVFVVGRDYDLALSHVVVVVPRYQSLIAPLGMLDEHTAEVGCIQTFHCGTVVSVTHGHQGIFACGEPELGSDVGAFREIILIEGDDPHQPAAFVEDIQVDLVDILFQYIDLSISIVSKEYGDILTVVHVFSDTAGDQEGNQQ